MRKALFTLLAAGILLISSRAYADTGTGFKFWASEDAFVQTSGSDATWADKNYGSETYLRSRDLDSSAYPNTLSRSFLKFSDTDLNQLMGLDIISVSLHLYEYERDAISSVADQINLFRVTEDWNQNDITWNAQAGHANKRVTYRNFDNGDTTPGWRSWQGDAFKNLIISWVNGANDNYGIMLENDLDGELNQMNAAFRSSEFVGGTSIYRPYLSIVATPEPLSSILLVFGAGFLGTFIGLKRKKIAKTNS